MTHKIWLLWIGEQSRGPYTSKEVMGLLRTGDITDTTLCQRDGETEWKPLKEHYDQMNIFDDSSQPDVVQPNAKPFEFSGNELILIGCLMVALGCAIGFYFGAAYQVTAPDSEIINIGRMNNRTLGVNAALASAVMGTILFGCGVIVQQIKMKDQGRK